MPLYSFRCRGCQRTTDLFRSIENRDNPAPCSSCAAWSGRRIQTAPGLIGETVVRDQRPTDVSV